MKSRKLIHVKLFEDYTEERYSPDSATEETETIETTDLNLEDSETENTVGMEEE